MSLVLLCALVAALLGVGGAPAASADELVPGRTYAAGTAMEAPSLGVAFVMPEGWVGKFAQDAKSQVVGMGSKTIEGVERARLADGSRNRHSDSIEERNRQTRRKRLAFDAANGAELSWGRTDDSRVIDEFIVFRAAADPEYAGMTVCPNSPFGTRSCR